MKARVYCGIAVGVFSVLTVTLWAEEGTKILKKAHDARATWNGFPGFRAQVLITDGDTTAKGWIEVDGQGNIKWVAGSAPSWFDGKIKSFVEHRFESSASPRATLEAESVQHPLGQLLKLDDDYQSRYRVDGDVIREVHRQTGDGHFTITVMDVERNPAGKYLPRVYTVSYWNGKGELTAVTTEVNEWRHLEGWDLPRQWLTVRSANSGERQVRSVVFTDHTLLRAQQ